MKCMGDRHYYCNTIVTSQNNLTLNSARATLNYTVLGKFANPTIAAFLVLRYVRNDSKLHFHIFLVTQKRGDYTFVLDLVKTMEIQTSKLRHCRGTVSLSTCGRRFFIKSSFLQRNRR